MEFFTLDFGIGLDGLLQIDCRPFFFFFFFFFTFEDSQAQNLEIRYYVPSQFNHFPALLQPMVNFEANSTTNMNE